MVAATPAAAQMAGALGKPLPSPDLAVGTVSVRIVAGSAASPVVGTDVTLIVNGAARAARTDSAGRATFANLPPGATVVAKVLDEDKAEKGSEEFRVPDSGGVRVMISTKPWQTGGAGGGAPFAGGGAGMPNPRQLSGEPRPQPGDPPGTITVRIAYDDFSDSPEGTPVTLVGYAADDTVTYQVVKTDAGGRAVFSDLDRSGGTAYFAMALLPREGAVDRVTSTAVLLDSQNGIRMVLSGEKRASKAPSVDDLAKLDQQIPTPAGKVRAVLEGLADLTSKVTLVDAATHKVISEVKPEPAPPDPSRVAGGAQFIADGTLPAGTLDIEVLGGAGQNQNPMPGIEIRIIPESSTDPNAGQAATTGGDGTVRMTVKATEQVKAVFVINGRQLASQAFDLAKSGGKLSIKAQWEETGRPHAMLDAGTTDGQTVYVECQFRNQHYRSLPFQVRADAGTKITIYAYPRILFRFALHAFVEDQLLAAQGRFEISNYSWAPYRAGPDGLVVPMPRGFKGGVVFGNDQAEVAVAAGEGFRIIRPVPPGGRTFHGGFSLGVQGGKTEWALDLPMGAYQSELDIRLTPGMTVQTPPTVQGEVRTIPEGRFFLIDPIMIQPRQSMVMTIEGMPSEPAWRVWVPRLVGLLVIAVLGGGVFLALYRRPQAATATAATAATARRQRLLDELVELERTGQNPKRRDQVLAELEELWS